MSKKVISDNKEPLFDLAILKKFNQLFEDFKHNHDKDEKDQQIFYDSFSSNHSFNPKQINGLGYIEKRYNNSNNIDDGDEYLEQKRRKIRNKYFLHYHDNIAYDNNRNKNKSMAQTKLPLIKSGSKTATTNSVSMPQISLSKSGPAIIKIDNKTNNNNNNINKLKNNGGIESMNNIGGHTRKTVKKRLKGMSIFLFKNDFNSEDNENYTKMEKFNHNGDIDINNGKYNSLFDMKKISQMKPSSRKLQQQQGQITRKKDNFFGKKIPRKSKNEHKNKMKNQKIPRSYLFGT